MKSCADCEKGADCLEVQAIPAYDAFLRNANTLLDDRHPPTVVALAAASVAVNIMVVDLGSDGAAEWLREIAAKVEAMGPDVVGHA